MSVRRSSLRAVRDPIRRVAWPLLATLTVATHARAATLDVNGGVLVYTAATGVANALVVSLPGASYTIDDPAEATVLPTAGALLAGCVNLDANTVSCPESAIGAWNVQLSDLADSANLAAVLEPATFRGGDEDDVLIGGLGADTFTWLPGDDDDLLEGGPGFDVLDFDGSNGNEIFDVAESGDGFYLFRNLGNVVLHGASIESLVLETFGGDDVVSTVGLAGTSQSFDGGLQSVTDTLSYDAGGQCAFQAPGSIRTPGRQTVFHTGFEAIPTLDECPAVAAPTLGPLGFAALAVALGLVLGGLAPRASDP